MASELGSCCRVGGPYSTSIPRTVPLHATSLVKSAEFRENSWAYAALLQYRARLRWGAIDDICRSTRPVSRPCGMRSIDGRPQADLRRGARSCAGPTTTRHRGGRRQRSPRRNDLCSYATVPSGTAYAIGKCDRQLPDVSTGGQASAFKVRVQNVRGHEAVELARKGHDLCFRCKPISCLYFLRE